MKQSWFEVSKQGLKEILGTKPKWRLIGELVQNAFDEPIRYCAVTIGKLGEGVIIKVTDDSPIGFRRMEDAYTLFGWTYKRELPEKRGRFNIGEKLILSICEEAAITTTKGKMIFNEEGRKETSAKRSAGTEVMLKLKMSPKEVKESIEALKKFKPPVKVEYTVNGDTIKYQKPDKEFESNLKTEVYNKERSAMYRTNRKTMLYIYKATGSAWLYEIGIPVQKIGCKYDIDVQQKVPLSMDRLTVLPSFLKDVYAETLNRVADEVGEEESSEAWIRDAMSDDRIENEAVKTVVHKRYGDKVCVRTVNDQRSIDEAICRGYKVLSGSELSKDEWDQIRKAEAITSSGKLFGASLVGAEAIPENKWTEDQKAVVAYAKMIARECLGKNITVSIVKSEAREVASYGNGHLSFNQSNLSKKWWGSRVSEPVTNLIIHELGHEGGLHYEHKYHDTLTLVGAKLSMLALRAPDKFKQAEEENLNKMGAIK